MIRTATINLTTILVTTAAYAQYPDPEVKNVTNLLKPNADCRGDACKARACRLEIDGTNVPCELVWYIEFKDGSHAVQFNKGTGNKPMVSFSGSSGDPDTIKVDTVMLRSGDRTVATDEGEATGLCQLSINKVTASCQARLRDGRLLVGSIFVGRAR